MRSALNVKFGTILTSANAAQFLSVTANATVDCTICRQKRHVAPLRSGHKTLTVRRLLFLNFCVMDEWQLIGRDNVQAMKIHLCSWGGKKAMIFSSTLQTHQCNNERNPVLFV
jgi:hypothetical protein